MSERKLWTQEEDELLRSLWATEADRCVIVASLPSRAWTAIKRRAVTLGVCRLALLFENRIRRIALWPDTEAAWLAGFTDGEGTISISYSAGTGQPYYAIANTDLAVLRAITGMVGYGSINKVNRRSDFHKPGFQYAASKRIVVEAVLRKIEPFLRVKRTQANLVLSFIEHVRSGTATLRSIAFYLEASRSLNRKGVHSEPEIVMQLGEPPGARP